jgi:hypothetical protein
MAKGPIQYEDCFYLHRHDGYQRGRMYIDDRCVLDDFSLVIMLKQMKR